MNQPFNVNKKALESTNTSAMTSLAWAYFCLGRLHKFPSGTIVLFWPCVWALLMAGFKVRLSPEVFVSRLGVYFIGCTLLHSAGCAYNDICDKDVDSKVERTKNRPLPSGLVSIRGAFIHVSWQVSICLVLLLFRGRLLFTLGLVNVFVFDALYPFMKRVTYWPQAWLGLAINWGFVVVWFDLCPEHVNVSMLGVALSGMICWTVVYDTMYACQDRIDDMKAGYKSTAILFYPHTVPISAVFALLFVTSLVLIGTINGQTLSYYVISAGGSATHLAWQLCSYQVDNPANCYARFKSNGLLGGIIAIGLLVDYLKVVL